MSIHDLKFLEDQLDELKQQGVYRKLPIVETPNDAEIILNGRKVINLSSNNYLGFANHPRLKAAAIKAIEDYGVGAGAVKTIVGNMSAAAAGMTSGSVRNLGGAVTGAVGVAGKVPVAANPGYTYTIPSTGVVNQSVTVLPAFNILSM